MKSNKKKKEHLDGVIYKYTNKINGKIYIGQTVNEKARIREHKNPKPKEKNCPFHRAISKYGWDNFTYEVIFRTVSYSINKMKCILNTMEVYFIKKFHCLVKEGGYNVTIGGSNVAIGIPLSSNVKQKISESKQRNPYHHTEKHKKRLSVRNSGENNPYYGKKHSEEIRKKMSDSSSCKRAIVQLTLDGEFINEYSFIKEVLTKSSLVKGKDYKNPESVISDISKCCLKREHSLSAYGYMWMYKEDYDNHLVNNIPILSRRPYKNCNIVQKIKDGVVIKEFSSQIEASKAIGKYSKFFSEKFIIAKSDIIEYDGFIWRKIDPKKS